MAEQSFDYDAPGRLTRLTGPRSAACEDLPSDPVAICSVVRSLVIEPRDAVAAGIADERAAERNLRPIDPATGTWAVTGGKRSEHPDADVWIVT